MNAPAANTRVTELLAAHDAYLPVRQRFVAALGMPLSHRDPLAELSEQLVDALLRGTTAASRVRPGYAFTFPKVHVRYLANPPGMWVNEHLVHRIPGVAQYALVLFESFAIVGVLVFPTDNLAMVCAALGKRHGRQDETLQFTRRNWQDIRQHPRRYRALGMGVWLPPIEAPLPERPRPAPAAVADRPGKRRLPVP